MFRRSKKKNIPDITEFIDEAGKKWVQTSAEDLFSTKEMNEIMKQIEESRVPDEIVIARIDFQKVNKEYYEKVIELQSKLKKQNDTLKTLLVSAKDTIDKKNKKLKELISYIKKLHLILAYYKTSPEDVDKLLSSPEVLYKSIIPEPQKHEVAQIITEERIIEYAEAHEILLDNDGKEIETVQ